MQTYWDLTEKERAQLTAEEVERFVDAELMLKGVLKVKPLQLTSVPEMPKPDLNLYVPHHGAWHSGNVGYEHEPRALDALDVGLFIEPEYVNGQSVSVAKRLDKETDCVKAVRCYSETQFKNVRAAIEKSAAAKSANERAEREHSEALTKQSAALKGMLGDWHECRAKNSELSEVVDTFRDYEKTAGDVTTAAKFLAKVFDASKIQEAAEWFDLEIPTATPKPVDPKPFTPTIQPGVEF